MSFDLLTYVMAKGSGGGGGEGTSDYTKLHNLPKINGTTITGNLKADAFGLANSYAYKLVMDEDNNRNYFINDDGEEIETAEVYGSMVDMALTSNALGIINLTFVGLENTNLARLYYTSIDIESDAQSLLFSARENHVLLCAKVERDNVEVVIRDVSDSQLIVRGILTMTSETTATISDLTADYDDIREAIDSGSNVKLVVVVSGTDTIIEFTHIVYGTDATNKKYVQFDTVSADRQSKIVIYEDGNNVVVIKNIQSKYIATTVTLSAADWSNNAQTVNVEGVTDDALVQVSPVPSDVDAYANAKIICTAQDDGTLTFICGSVPTSNLTVTVVNWG